MERPGAPPGGPGKDTSPGGDDVTGQATMSRSQLSSPCSLRSAAFRRIACPPVHCVTPFRSAATIACLSESDGDVGVDMSLHESWHGVKESCSSFLALGVAA